MILTDICLELNNWFDTNRIIGDFIITENAITDSDGEALPLQEGQYFRIIGSVFNDGVHQYGSLSLHPETYSGGVWAMAVPQSIITLATDIEDWVNKFYQLDSPNMSPYQSESFGGYSYSKGANTSSGVTSSSASWQNVFASRLKPYRKLNLGGR